MRLLLHVRKDNGLLRIKFARLVLEIAQVAKIKLENVFSVLQATPFPLKTLCTVLRPVPKASFTIRQPTVVLIVQQTVLIVQKNQDV